MLSLLCPCCSMMPCAHGNIDRLPSTVANLFSRWHFVLIVASNPLFLPPPPSAFVKHNAACKHDWFVAAFRHHWHECLKFASGNKGDHHHPTIVGFWSMQWKFPKWFPMKLSCAMHLSPTWKCCLAGSECSFRRMPYYRWPGNTFTMGDKSGNKITNRLHWSTPRIGIK